MKESAKETLAGRPNVTFLLCRRLKASIASELPQNQPQALMPVGDMTTKLKN
ncbi:hypothetical protein Hanom_Chr11g01047021 [Helianthus anomalus]